MAVIINGKSDEVEAVIYAGCISASGALWANKDDGLPNLEHVLNTALELHKRAIVEFNNRY